MNFSSSFKKTLKSQGSGKHSRKISATNEDEMNQEHHPILFDSDQLHLQNNTPMRSDDRQEVIVKIDGVDRSKVIDINDNDCRENNNRNNNDNNVGTSSTCSSLKGWEYDNKTREESIYKFSTNRGRGGGHVEEEFEFRPQQHQNKQHKNMVEDPPSKLIGQFINKQKAAGVDVSLDVDLELDEPRNGGRVKTNNYNNNSSNNLQTLSSSPPTVTANPASSRPLDQSSRRSSMHNITDGSNRASKELKVSFQTLSSIAERQNKPPLLSSLSSASSNSSSDYDNNDNNGGRDGNYEENGDSDRNARVQQCYTRKRSGLSAGMIGDDNNYEMDQVLKCTSFQRRPTMLKTKTKSRFAEPVEMDPRSGKLKSGIWASGTSEKNSGMLGKQQGDNFDEDDPFFEEDIPDDFKKGNLNVLTLIQWISLVLIIASLLCTLLIPSWKNKELNGLELWKWEVLILVLICGRLVSGWVIRILVLLIERNFLLRKKVLYFVYGLRKAVQNCLWLGLVLVAWHMMFDDRLKTSNKFLKFMNNLMLCIVVAPMIWLVKTLMVKVLASSFHVSTYFDRIQESIFNQYVIETLSGPPLIELQNDQEEEEKALIAEIWQLQNSGSAVPPGLKGLPFSSTKMDVPKGSGLLKGPSRKVSGPLCKNDDKGITIDVLHRLNNQNVSAWNMKRLINIVRHGVLSTLDEQEVHTAHEDDSAKHIRSEHEAKVAARKIFRNVARHGSKFIYVEDLMRFLQSNEALQAMNVIEGSTVSERISKSTLKNWLVEVFRERQALALTLNDTKTAVNRLHHMVNALVGLVIFIVCLIILGLATSQFLYLVSSQIVVVAFIFGNTCKTIFEAIIFLFVMHPFDVGDRCEVDGVQMIVEEMNILTTVFLRFDNNKIIFPNSTLATKAIHNYYRSPDMGDSIEFYIHIATPEEKIALMKQRIISFIESKKDYWYSSPAVVLMDMNGLKKLKMSVWLRHKMNHQNMGERYIRRASVAEEMVKIFKELDIEFRMDPLDINIRSMPKPISTTLLSA